MESRLEVTYVGNLPLSSPEASTLVESDGDYVQICHAIAREGLAAQEKELWVREWTHYVWLKEFLAQLDLSVQFSEKTAKDVLAERLRVRIPQWLSDEEIVTENLLDLVADEEF